MVEMVVRRIGMDQQGQALVILSDLSGERLLPILIGPFEAHAIAMEMRGEKFERPLTHDLFVSALDALGYTLVRIEVTRLESGVFYALLHIGNGERVTEVDSRPSDAIALALRTAAKVYIAEEVLDQAQVRMGDIEDAEEEERSAFKDLIEQAGIDSDADGGADLPDSLDSPDGS